MESLVFNLTIGAIKISTVENASAVNIGKNLLLDWDSHSKTNQGLGNISGDHNGLQHLANQVDDPDKLDFLSPSVPGNYQQEDLQQLINNFFQEEL